MTSLLRTVCIVALLAGGAASAHAEDMSAVVAAVPTDVSEIVSGGNWTQGDVSGVFRAITVTRQSGGATQANVIVQMLATDKAGGAPKVTKTIAVKEVEDKKLANAFLALDVENDNELTLIITSYDAEKDQDTSLLVKFDATGKYAIVTPPKEDAAAPGAAPTEVPPPAAK